MWIRDQLSAIRRATLKQTAIGFGIAAVAALVITLFVLAPGPNAQVPVAAPVSTSPVVAIPTPIVKPLVLDSTDADANKALGSAIASGVKDGVQPQLDGLVDLHSQAVKAIKDERKLRGDADDVLAAQLKALGDRTLKLEERPIIKPEEIKEEIKKELLRDLHLKPGETLSQLLDRLRKGNEEVAALKGNFPPCSAA